MGIYILCPYYKRDRKRSITCEDTIRLYPTPKEKNAVIKRHCASSWKSCPYASRMESVYSLDLPYEEIKEKIMENKIEEMEKEINKLMRENGQLQKKLQNYEAEIKQYQENIDLKIKECSEKGRTIANKDKELEWTRSFAAAFICLAFDDNVKELRMSPERINNLMHDYNLEYRFDQEEQTWIISCEKVKGERS